MGADFGGFPRSHIASSKHCKCPTGKPPPKTSSLLPSAPRSCLYSFNQVKTQLTRTLTGPLVLTPLLSEEPLPISHSKRSPKSQSRQKWSPSQALLERATSPHTHPCQTRRCRDQGDMWRGRHPACFSGASRIQGASWSLLPADSPGV